MPNETIAAAAASKSPELPTPLPRRGNRRWLRGLLIFVTCVLLVDALFGERGLAETLRARRDYAVAQAEIAALRRENARLAEYARQLLVDPATIESVAREELGLLRPGEVLIVLRSAPRKGPLPGSHPSSLTGTDDIEHANDPRE